MMARNAAARTTLPIAIQRGDGTRNRLIEAAIDIFAAHGFDGASTRTLAEKAGANLAAIPYHFGSKAGLYRAAAQHIADGLNAKMLPTVIEVETALENESLERRELLELLDRLMVRKFAATVLASAEADSWSYFIVREQMRPGEGFEILYRSVMARLQRLSARLVGRLLKMSEDDPRVSIRATAMMGEILIFRTGRAALMKRLGWSRFTEDRLEHVQSVLSENFQRILSAPARERQ